MKIRKKSEVGIEKDREIDNSGNKEKEVV